MGRCTKDVIEVEYRLVPGRIRNTEGENSARRLKHSKKIHAFEGIRTLGRETAGIDPAGILCSQSVSSVSALCERTFGCLLGCVHSFMGGEAKIV